MSIMAAPFHGGMHLGQGFNSYTQELRLEEAVTIVLPPKPTQVIAAAAAKVPTSPTQQVQPAQPVQSTTTTTTDSSDPAAVTKNDGQTNAAPGATVAKAINALLPDDVLKGNSRAAEDTHAEKPTVADVHDGSNAKLAPQLHDTLLSQVNSDLKGPRFVLPDVQDGDDDRANQTVTFSSRAVSDMSDIMDALNLSASTSIKYGTVHGGGSASFVNEDKILDSQLNYLVSVKVNNNNVKEAESMTFKPIAGITPDKFTDVYGDCFIAGFQTGGEFNAIISVDCHDKSKARAVKEALDLEFATAVPGLTAGGGQNLEKSHSNLLRGVEMSISVNWTGGGVLKPSEYPWDLKTVLEVANAYPSMVARSAARITAILRPYTSLTSFITWQYAQRKEYNDNLIAWEAANPIPAAGADPKVLKARETERNAMVDARDLWTDKALILNYAPCQMYTNDLFNAFMQYKKLWKRITFMLSDTSKWRMRKREDIIKDIGPTRFDSFETPDDQATGSKPAGPQRTKSGPPLSIPPSIKENEAPNGTFVDNDSPVSATKDFALASRSSEPQTPHLGSLSRWDTFNLMDKSIPREWNVDKLNKTRDPISLDPLDLNEARLLCREAMTLITEEAYSLVYHPDLAYAEYHKENKTARMKRPIYAYPEVLKARLPVFIRNDAATSQRSRDPLILRLKLYDNNDLWASMVGDDLDPKWHQTPFISLDRNEALDKPYLNSPLIGMSIHAYAHDFRYNFMSSWWKDSNRAIGGFGFKFEGDKDRGSADLCTQWEGENQTHDERLFTKLMFRNVIKDMKEDVKKEEVKKDQPKVKDETHLRDLIGIHRSSSSKSVKLDANMNTEVPKQTLLEAASEDVNIQKIVVWYMPGSGRISGLEFWDANQPTRLRWTQWEGQTPPREMKQEENYPPSNKRWQFVGIMGYWVSDLTGHNKVLGRVSGIWREY